MTAEVISGAQILEMVGATGDPSWESEYVEKAIAGVGRALLRQPEFVAAVKTTIDNPFSYPADEAWSTDFQIGPTTYKVSHAAVIRPTNHYFTERFDLEREENGVINKGSFCSIPADSNEKPHIWPRAEVTIGENEPLTGMPALQAMNEAFPELGLIWQNVIPSTAS